MQDSHTLSIIIVIAVITFGLRALPIWFGNRIFKNNELLTFIGEKMPVGVMSLLVIYTLKDENYITAPYGAPLIVTSLITIMLYWRFHNALLAIFTGLAIYLLWHNIDFIT
ncbi:MAG: AzlD domain-containing protein [Alphaproteobacteria bacterium]|nr:AzlD domain-containing protein [Alphaproteobacteria bacterium]